MMTTIGLILFVVGAFGAAALLGFLPGVRSLSLSEGAGFRLAMLCVIIAIYGLALAIAGQF
jgi:hypothetical protein